VETSGALEILRVTKAVCMLLHGIFKNALAYVIGNSMIKVKILSNVMRMLLDRLGCRDSLFQTRLYKNRSYIQIKRFDAVDDFIAT
jgi:hypothetical protein